jgi:AcrR family transcriptional regulator
MGIKERKLREKEVLRYRIMEAASEILIEEGYKNFSVRKIAQKIEYSPTTIYLYFKDKTDLIFNLLENTFSKFIEELEGSVKTAGSPLEKVEQLIEAYVRIGLKYPNHYRIMFANEIQGEKEFRWLEEGTFNKKAFDYLLRSVTQCFENRDEKDVDVVATCQVLWASVHGLTSILIFRPDFPWKSEDILIDCLKHQALAGLRSKIAD